MRRKGGDMMGIDAVGALGSETWSQSDWSLFARQWPEEQAVLSGSTDVMGREGRVCLQANWTPSAWVIDEKVSAFVGVAYVRSCIGQRLPRRLLRPMQKVRSIGTGSL